MVLDLRNGEEPAPEYNGQYSAELFSQKAASVIENHENHEKVTHTVAQNTAGSGVLVTGVFLYRSLAIKGKAKNRMVSMF